MPRYEYTYSRVVTPAASQDLITLDQAKVVLGIPVDDTSQDAVIKAQIASVSAGISNYCDRLFPVQTYRDQYRSPSLGRVRARQFPIVLEAGAPKLFTITIDGAVLPPESYDLDAELGWVYPLDGGFSGNQLLIDYTAGYDPMPPDLQAAANEWLTQRSISQGRDPSVRSEAIPDVITVVYHDPTSSSSSSAAGDAEGPPPGVCNWLVPYRLWSA